MKATLALAGACCVLAGLVAAAWGQDEQILKFQSDIRVEADATMTVVESLQVEAAGIAIKHGIYRDFPQLYRNKLGLRTQTGFQVIAVERDGRAEPYHTEPRANGTRLYIGDASTMVAPGIHFYRLSYRTDHQIGFYKDHDELYWNVTGNGWDFPIREASANVRLPGGAIAKSMEAYTGPQGAKGKAYASETLEDGASFQTTAPLGPHEGLTIVVTWAKGYLTAPPPASLIRSNPGVSLAAVGLLLVLFYYAVAWALMGRDPERGTIIPMYGPPPDISPAAARYLMEMGYDDKVFTAAVIDLAVKGGLKIREKNKAYSLVRESGPKRPLTSDESALFTKLFGGRNNLELKNSNHQLIQEARRALKLALASKLEKSHFVRNLKFWLPGLILTLIPLGISLMDAREIAGAAFMLVWLSIWTVGVTALVSSAFGLWRNGSWGSALFTSLFALPFVAGELFGLGMLISSTSILVTALFVIGISMNGIFYHLLKAPTHFGRRVLDHLEGFKEYLSVAEKDRLNLENPPSRTPELFEMFLPYALALGVEQQWSEQFSDVLSAAEKEGYSPSWYSGNAWSALNAGTFADSLGSSFSSAISSASTAPGSSSGSGGGGSSGGGGGGGGGGGW